MWGERLPFSRKRRARQEPPPIPPEAKLKPPVEPEEKPIQYIHQCEHRKTKKGKMRAFGATRDCALHIPAEGRACWCATCLSQMAIQCAICHEAIFPWDPIRLIFHVDSRVLPEHAFKDPARKDKLWVDVVGCNRLDCAPMEPGKPLVVRAIWMPSDDLVVGQPLHGRVYRLPEMQENKSEEVSGVMPVSR